jgi:tetratricopeptide (TPR) repeat protein
VRLAASSANKGRMPERKSLMMNWDLVQDDPYYRGRAVEAKARRESSVEAWQEYADLKEKKGSYALAVHGYLNAAMLFERQDCMEEAFEQLAKASLNARRTGSRELTMVVAYHHAMLAERLGRWDICIEVYEALGNYCEELGSYFLAADAYEHAAEAMANTGKDIATYTKPIELWERNARHWRELGHEDDAWWSERHIDLYKSLFGGRPA